MKKIWKGLLVLLACGMLIFGAVACGGKGLSSSENSSSVVLSSESVSSIEESSSESVSLATECEHTVEEWVRSNEKTCDIALFYGTCTTCEDVIMVVGREHTYTESGTVEATCTSGGYDWKRCSVCGFKEKSNEVQPLTHDFGEWETYTAATCTRVGVEKQYCQRENCSHYESRTINALEHDLGEWETTVAATCYLAGEEIRYCKRDGCTHSYYDDTPYHESRIIDAIAPTEGHNVSNGKCVRCQKVENTDLRFIILNGAYQCFGIGNCKDRDIIIPKTYNNKAVTSIGDMAFEECYNLTNIEIPNSVTSIGYAAFRYCRGLTNIEIPNSVTRIGYSAFSNCSNLTSVIFEDTEGWTIGGNETIFDPYSSSYEDSSSSEDAVSSYEDFSSSEEDVVSSYEDSSSEEYSSEEDSSEEGISFSTVLADASTAAYYLTNRYCFETWIKK